MHDEQSRALNGHAFRQVPSFVQAQEISVELHDVCELSGGKYMCFRWSQMA